MARRMFLQFSHWRHSGDASKKVAKSGARLRLRQRHLDHNEKSDSHAEAAI